jgi:hypothetical protein
MTICAKNRIRCSRCIDGNQYFLASGGVGTGDSQFLFSSEDCFEVQVPMGGSIYFNPASVISSFRCLTIRLSVFRMSLILPTLTAVFIA